jgi:AcrR family transcriptional regulator
MELTSLRERQKERRRARIYQVAIELFKERGFQQTTATDIAKGAHVSRGTFFNYYPYKESVLLDYGALIIEGIQTHTVAALEAGGEPLATLEELWVLLAHETAKERDLFPPLAYEFLNPNPERARIAYNSVPLASVLQLVLKPLQAQSRVRSDISLERISNIIADNYLMTALRWAAYGTADSLQLEMKKALALLLEGVFQKD